MLLCGVRPTQHGVLHHVFHPGPPPAGWVNMAAVTLVAVGVAVTAMIIAGALDGRPAKHFGEGRMGTFLSGALLLLAATLCATIAADRRSRQLRRFWVVAAVGFLYLTYDELGMVHENVSKLVHRAAGGDHRQGITSRLDDVVVLLYGVIAGAWALRYRAELLRLRWTTSTMALAGVAFLLSEAFDLARGWRTTEESFKILAEALIVVALLAARREINAPLPPVTSPRTLSA
jgi:hypothetical protein